MTADDRVPRTPEGFRDHIRRFLAEHHPGPPPRERMERLAYQRAWAEVLHDHGLVVPSWPPAEGGLGLSPPLLAVLYEEFVRTRVPTFPGSGLIVAPALRSSGTPEQRARWLDATLRARIIWGQGFSEPDAGSDLKALRTRARRDGDVYVVTGQKLWMSYGDVADWMFCLVRTGPEGSRGRGLSYLLIDATSPGITVRPLRTMVGSEDFCEVYFDDVRVPVGNRLGAEGDGWAVAKATLGHERSTAFVGQVMAYRRVIDELVALARDRGCLQDALVRMTLADLEMRLRVIHATGVRILGEISAGRSPTIPPSMSRLYYAEFEQRLHEVAVAMLGPEGLLERGDPDAVERGRWLKGLLATRASTIGAGTSEIQRNTIAVQVLGLPRDPCLPED